jgi:cell division protein ZapA
MDSNDPRKVVRVNIFNQNYTLATSGDPKDTEALAQQIDDLMSNIARRAGNLDSTRTAVLACLHLADELQSLKRSINHKSRDFALLLDQAIADAPPQKRSLLSD